MCRRRGLKVNTGKRKVIVFGEVGPVYDVIPEVCLEQVQSLKYLKCMLNKNRTDDTDIEIKVYQSRKIDRGQTY